MQLLALGKTGRRTTQLGFGCSSVMGALGRRESLSMLEAAFDAGVRHFDVAPMYGYGEAESCLGEFLARHSGQATVTTKYGIPPEPKQGMKSLARSVARPILKALPGVKKRLAEVARKTGSGAAEKSAFTPIEARRSLERSLRVLRADHIDLWLLHEVSAEDLFQNDGVLRLMEDAVAAGKIGSFGVGSGAEKIPALLAERPGYCRTLQYEWSVKDPAIPAGGPFRIHHRALTDHFRALHKALVAKPEICDRWSSHTGTDLADSELLAQLMLKSSLVMNPASVILFSSKRLLHIAANVLVAEDETMEAPARRLHELVQAEQSELFAGSGR
jgi:aryl-alcohol dehydrogenase-like predicted oxidoreductase